MDKLDLIYKILKVFETGAKPNAEQLGISQNEFIRLIEMISDAGLIKGALIQRGGKSRGVMGFDIDNADITLAGLHYLKDNAKN